ncbi:MAG: glutamate--cysteine ligase [Chlamydiales bacterium]|jgi:carboxylate-amine ligase|nr:glutamate--cysteine ligase [Chlamydiales bacterium]
MEKLILPLFQGYGIELEYMIVNKQTLNVDPITDKVLYTVAKNYDNEVERGEISWSNELALHVIELKTTKPAKSLKNLEISFQDNVRQINSILESFNACLMPTAMHPWMDPYQEMHLWPHEYNPIYEAYNRIFNCCGHGWANLQSTHINLPFADDIEFAQLHAAIRLLLPIMPALTASSPIVEEKLTGILDNRLHVYQNNAKIIPSITGKVIPEHCSSEKNYRESILASMYHEIAPYDPDKLLQHEWLNSHGAIARFERNTIEIRILDIQECPQADIAIATAIVETLKSLIAEKWHELNDKEWEVEPLYAIFSSCVKEGSEAIISNRHYLDLFGFPANATQCRAKELWQHIINSLDLNSLGNLKGILEMIIDKGTLAQRIEKAWKSQPTKHQLREIYEKLCYCLAHGELFKG